MPDRALYLAKTIVSRLRVLETDAAEELPPGQEIESWRQELVGKVMAVEVGVTDGAEIAMLTAAAPRLLLGQELTRGEIEDYAEFLRKHLGVRLNQA